MILMHSSMALVQMVVLTVRRCSVAFVHILNQVIIWFDLGLVCYAKNWSSVVYNQRLLMNTAHELNRCYLSNVSRLIMNHSMS